MKRNGFEREVVMAIRGEKEEERKLDKNLVPFTNSS